MQLKIAVVIMFCSSLIFLVVPEVSPSVARAALPTPSPSPQRRVVCMILSIQGSTMTVQKRNGTQLNVDIAQAKADQTTGILPLNKPIVLAGYRSADKVFHVTSISHSSPEWNDNAPDDDP